MAKRDKQIVALVAVAAVVGWCLSRRPDVRRGYNLSYPTDVPQPQGYNGVGGPGPGMV